MRETAAHRRLEWERAAAHVPCSVFQLCCHEVTQPTLHIWLGTREARADAHRIDGLSRGISIALQAGHLRPSAVAMLFGQKRLGEWLKFACGFPGPGKTKQLIDALFIVLRFGRPQPAACALNSFRELSLATGQGITL